MTSRILESLILLSFHPLHNYPPIFYSRQNNNFPGRWTTTTIIIIIFPRQFRLFFKNKFTLFLQTRVAWIKHVSFRSSLLLQTSGVLSTQNFQPDPEPHRVIHSSTYEERKRRRINTSRKYYVSKARIYTFAE